jgi:long-chain acyl-CoA synthetase
MSLNLATIVREGAARRPDKAAVIHGGVAVSYRALDEGARRFAGMLRKAGVERGQHVALMLPNVPEMPIAYYGCAYAGCPVVPLNVHLMPDEIAYHLDDSDAVALCAHESLADKARAGFERAERCTRFWTAETEGGLTALLEGAPPFAEPAHTAPDDTAVLLYTSGTTGRPKGAELTHFNLFYNADIASTLHGTHESTIALAVLPLFHSFGQTVIMNGTFFRGGTVVMLPRFDAQQAMEQIALRKVTFFAGVPTMYFALLHHPRAAEYDLSSLEVCASGGAPMPVEVMRTFDERYGADIIEGYGLSETSPVASLNVRDRPKRPGSIGVPLWGVEFRLVDDQGQVIAETGKPGEIHIRGHNIMKGYYKRPDATRDAIVDGWFKTGDIATRDDDGYYRIVDRKKDLILRGGYNVYPREVEEVLYAHPAVAEAAVIGVPDARLGEEVKAVVAFKPGAAASAEELIAHCQARIAAFKCPRLVDIIDALPKGPTGKILKRALRQ